MLGNTDHNVLLQVFKVYRNECSKRTGMGVQDGPEYAVRLIIAMRGALD
jgi:hypothetical protein